MHILKNNKNRTHNVMRILCFFCALLLIPVQSFSDAEKVFRNNNRAVVVVNTFDKNGRSLKQGSGFIVRSDGVIVSNYHVICNAARIEIKIDGQTFDVYGITYSDKRNDFVILKITKDNLPTITIGDSDSVNVGQRVYVIGSPHGLENTISEGILSGIRSVEPGKKILQISAPISQGSSGGPVFNKEGEVIAIVTAYIKQGQNLNLAMPINLIKKYTLYQDVIPLKRAGINKNEGGDTVYLHKELFKLKKIPVVKVSASSANYNKPHLPEMACDSNLDTYWSPYKKDIISSWIKFEFATEKNISKITIINGRVVEDEQTYKDIFFQAYRIKTLTLHYDDGTQEIIHLNNTHKKQTIIPHITTKTKTVKLVVDRIYPTYTNYNKILAISEVTFYE
jgi:hypothetical protein